MYDSLVVNFPLQECSTNNFGWKNIFCSEKRSINFRNAQFECFIFYWYCRHTFSFDTSSLWRDMVIECISAVLQLLYGCWIKFWTLAVPTSNACLEHTSQRHVYLWISFYFYIPACASPFQESFCKSATVQHSTGAVVSLFLPPHRPYLGIRWPAT